MADLEYVSELKLDYDVNYPQKRMSIPRICFIAKILRLNIVSVEAWNTKHGKHIKIIINEKIHPVAQILIQSLMGSDYGKEVYDMIRVFNLLRPDADYSQIAREHYNILFYKKKVGGEVVSWEEPDPRLTAKLTKMLKKATTYEAKENEQPA